MIRTRQNQAAKRMTGLDRRAQLLAKAKAIIRERGVAELTLATLADACGVTKPIAYNHFGTRENLLVELYRELGGAHEARARDATQAVRSETDAAQKAGAIIATEFIDCTMQNGDLYGQIMAALRASPNGAQICADLDAQITQSYSTALKAVGVDGQRAGLLAHGLIGAGAGLATAVGRGQASRDEAITLLGQFIAPLIDASG